MNEDNFEKRVNEFMDKNNAKNVCACDNIFNDTREFEDYLENEFGQYLYEFKYKCSYTFLIKVQDNPYFEGRFSDYTHVCCIKLKTSNEYACIGLNYCPKCGKKLENN